jgi:Mycothiol maleylpyruvate isomerase N-terminal domain
MSERGVEAFRADRGEVLKVAQSLSVEEWAMPSDCDGWRVQDVIAHMANVCRAVVDPGSLPPGVPGDLEATQAAQAEAHRTWTAEEVLADYEDVSGKALESVVGLQAPGMAETVIPIENAGHYPLHMVVNAFAFDHYCHLRFDMLRPNGPIDRPVPPSDDMRLGASLEWLVAGLPQMAADDMREAVTKPIGLALTGPGGGTWTIEPAAGDDLVDVEEGLHDDVAATITSSTDDFIVWATRRRPWTERSVELTGDGTYAARVVDAIHLF